MFSISSVKNGDVLFLAKVFPKRSYAEEFLQGKLYANRLSKFRCIEDDFVRGDKDEGGRGDKYEGGVMINRKGIVMTIQSQDPETGEEEEVTLEESDFGSSIKMSLPYFDQLNLFCMRGVHISSSDLTTEDITTVERKVSFSKKYPNLGDHVVVITDALKFIRRVVATVNQKRYQMEYDFVNYYDPDVGTSLLPETTRTLFAKQNKYAWQEEFRFVFNTKTEGDEAVILDIGRIDDIAYLEDTSIMINPTIQIPTSGGNPAASG
ncbi:MAG: hypothetical protein OXI80_00120 [Caldilineaceae bacterium]|nr:hypothetical protein [Caldilineaceae bacterium]MDE0336046.1 hypothetical protein [Caldilineaceae bacterium]